MTIRECQARGNSPLEDHDWQLGDVLLLVEARTEGQGADER